MSDPLNIKKVDSEATMITGGPGVGKTLQLKKIIAEMCARNAQCIVFSCFGDYRKECENANGKYIIVTENYSFDSIPGDKIIVFSFEQLSEKYAIQPFIALLQKVYEAIKSDTVKKKCLILDITTPVYEATQDIWTDMVGKVRKLNADLFVAYQEADK